jgi:hypothetical protein
MDIRLIAVPEFPPFEMHERITYDANYPTTLAHLHIYLDGINATSDISSAYMLWLSDHLLVGVSELLEGNDVTAKWFSDPWQLEMHPHVNSNRLLLTLNMLRRPTPINNVEVPLDQFIQEVIKLGKSWGKYLEQIYLDEIYHPEKGEQFRRFEKHLMSGELAWKRHRGEYS